MNDDVEVGDRIKFHLRWRREGWGNHQDLEYEVVKIARCDTTYDCYWVIIPSGRVQAFSPDYVSSVIKAKGPW